MKCENQPERETNRGGKRERRNYLGIGERERNRGRERNC